MTAANKHGHASAFSDVEEQSMVVQTVVTGVIPLQLLTFIFG